MLQYSFMRNALMAGLMVSILCPMIGMFVVLKRYSMLGDTLSHTSLAGLALGLVFGFNPLISAFIFTSLCGLVIESLRNNYKKYEELIMVIILTLGLGIGITLISSGLANANINSYLFGSILTVTIKEIYTIFILSIVSIITLLILYNKLIYITFDEEGAKITGIKVKLINYIFMFLVGATISVSLKIMGMLVISSMITVPVATAMQLNKSFKKTLLFSILFGMIDTLGGLILSVYLDAASGGLIAITSVSVLLIVLIYKKVTNI
ncbi:MAG: metal ABC transporter permease [Clostridiaceae bacterium]